MQHDGTKLGIQSKRLKAGWDERYLTIAAARGAEDQATKDKHQGLEY
ncbi:hypothetical protein [Thiorhodococcus minor]|uniref:Uncharacterized protein n=1 Tax=Thiorhodococcus minor TaxID=57489 RepID=A0A6M0K5Y9_9GAMM|nr:hypothetical protein [Thiorhodococcus minor]NEV65196.1 hypothetical protein [Thiorhodococcus minor]